MSTDQHYRTSHIFWFQNDRAISTKLAKRGELRWRVRIEVLCWGLGAVNAPYEATVAKHGRGEGWSSSFSSVLTQLWCNAQPGIKAWNLCSFLCHNI